jgi:hypothetical protein
MKKIYYICMALVFGFASCKKEAYLTDGGLHSPQVDKSTYDYLAAHPHKMFDTLLLIVDHFNLKNEINSAKTFWAPSDYSIKRFYQLKEQEAKLENENITYTFDEFLSDLNVDSIRSYIYNGGNYDLNSAKSSYEIISNVSNVEAFAYHKVKQAQGQWSYQDYFHLFYVKVRGEADQINEDGTVMVDRNDIADLRIKCQTSGIRTSTGTTINVLENTHVFLADFNVVLNSGPVIEDLENGIRFTYDLKLKAAADYSHVKVDVPMGWMADVFSLPAAEIPGMIGNSIIFYAIEPNGSLNNNYTAAAPGHWFDTNGNVVAWGGTAMMFSEFKAGTLQFEIGQYPSRLARGDVKTLKQAFVYTNRNNVKMRAEFIFNVTIN